MRLRAGAWPEFPSNYPEKTERPEQLGPSRIIAGSRRDVRCPGEHASSMESIGPSARQSLTTHRRRLTLRIQHYRLSGAIARFYRSIDGRSERGDHRPPGSPPERETLSTASGPGPPDSASDADGCPLHWSPVKIRTPSAWRPSRVTRRGADINCDERSRIARARKQVAYKPEAPASGLTVAPGIHSLALRACIRFVRIFVAGVV